jgi:hypothetical protein
MDGGSSRLSAESRHASHLSAPVVLSAEDQAAFDAAQAEFDGLTEQYEAAEELSDDADAIEVERRICVDHRDFGVQQP